MAMAMDIETVVTNEKHFDKCLIHTNVEPSWYFLSQYFIAMLYLPSQKSYQGSHLIRHTSSPVKIISRKVVMLRLSHLELITGYHAQM